MNALEAFELLTILDSPLLVTQAPELIPYRAEVEEAVKPLSGDGCTACQKRAMFAKLATIQTTMQDRINQSPELLTLVPTLLASAKLVRP